MLMYQCKLQFPAVQFNGDNVGDFARLLAASPDRKFSVQLVADRTNEEPFLAVYDLESGLEFYVMLDNWLVFNTLENSFLVLPPKSFNENFSEKSLLGIPA